MSGNKIKKAKRKVEFDPSKRYENKWVYRRNNIEKRHIENPNVYEGEIPRGASFYSIRLPKKCRKTAWKRFKKNFPYVKVTKSGGKLFNEQKFKEFYERTRNKG